MTWEQQLKNEAKKYIELGISVIPVGKDKIPALKSWKEFQTRLPSEKELDGFFNQENLQGLAVITGKFTKLVAIDIDNINTFLDIQQKYGTPDTPLARSHKGYHLYFQYPDGIELGGSVLFPNVEIKGEGNCITVPPSKHPKGTEYKWIKSIFDVKLAPLPEWILEASPNRKKGQLEKIIGGVELGNRDNSAVSVAGKIIYSFKPEEWPTIGWTLFMSWNKENKPPLSELQLKKCWESVIKREKRRREQNLPPLTPLISPLSHQDFRNKKIPPVRWIIDRIIPYAGITALTAPPAHYKTWFALFLAIKIAKGEKLWDKYDITQSNVLFVNEEVFEGLIQDRIKLLTQDEELPIYYFNNCGIKMSQERIDELLAICEEKNIKLIVFDSLIRIHDLDENSSKDMGKLKEMFAAFTNKEIAIIFTHHNRKQGQFVSKYDLEKMRGSSDIGAFVDTNIGMNVKQNNEIVIYQGKQRGQAALDPIMVKFVITDGKANFEFMDSIQREYAKEIESRGIVLESIENNPGITQRELIERYKIAPATLTRAIRDLEESNEIFADGKKPKRYFKKEAEKSLFSDDTLGDDWKKL